MKKNILFTFIFFINLFFVYNVHAESIFEVKFKDDPDNIFRFSSLQAVESFIENRYDLNINEFYKYTRQKNSDTVYNYQIKKNNYKIYCAGGNARNTPLSDITHSRCYPNDGTEVFYYNSPPNYYNVNDLIKEDEFKDYDYLRSFYFNYNLINIEEDIKNISLNTFYCDYNDPNFLNCEKAISNLIYDIEYDFNDYKNEMYIRIELAIAYKRNFLNNDTEDGNGACNDIPIEPNYNPNSNCTQYTTAWYTIEMNFPEIEVIERKQSEYTDIPYEIIEGENAGRIFYSKEICLYYFEDKNISYSSYEDIQVDIINEELFCKINNVGEEQKKYKPESESYIKKYETEISKTIDVLVLYDYNTNIEYINNLIALYKDENSNVFLNSNISNFKLNFIDSLKIQPELLTTVYDNIETFENCAIDKGYFNIESKVSKIFNNIEIPLSNQEMQDFQSCINKQRSNFQNIHKVINLKNNYIYEYIEKTKADIYFYISNIDDTGYSLNHKGLLQKGSILGRAYNSPFSTINSVKNIDKEGKKSLILEDTKYLGFIINNQATPDKYSFIFSHEIGHLLGNTHDPITYILNEQQKRVVNEEELSCYSEYVKYINNKFVPKYVYLENGVYSICFADNSEPLRSEGFHKHSQGFYHYDESDLSGNSNWVTVMGYPDSVLNSEDKADDRRPYFSSPDLICDAENNIPCGKDKDSVYQDEKGYDALSTVKVTYPLLSSIRDRENMDYKYKIQEVTETADILLGTPFDDDLVLGGGNDIVLSSTGKDKINFKDNVFNSDRFYVSSLNKIEETTITDLDLQDSIYIENSISYSIDYNNNDYIFINFSDSQLLIIKKIQDDIVFEEAQCSYEECNFDGINYIKLKLANSSSNDVYGDNTDNDLVGNDSNNSIYGGDGNDNIQALFGANYLYGGNGDDTLGNQNTNSADWLGNNGEYDPITEYGNYYEGGIGNDIIYGTRYGDTYFFEEGFGNDTILDYTNILENNQNLDDIIRFGQGIFSFNQEVTRTDTDVIITNLTDNSSITIIDSVTNPNNIIEYFFFEEETLTWNWENDIKPRYLNHSGTINNDTLNSIIDEENTLNGLTGDDILNGANLNDTLNGNEGNDKLYGNYGYDTLNGNEGDDILGSVSKGSKDFLGNEGDFDPVNNFGQVYNGGKGFDLLYGTRYGDTYIFNLNDGIDTIFESTTVEEDFPNTKDILIFNNVNSNDFVISRDDYDLILTTLSTGDIVRVDDALMYTTNKIEEIQLSDVTIDWNLIVQEATVLHGNDSSNTLRGISQYSNTIYGHGSRDYIYGDNQVDYLYGGDGNDSLNGYYNYDYLYGGDGNDILGSSSTSNKEYKGNPSNVFDSINSYGNYYDGGTGDDKLYGSQYGDTYYFEFGHGEDYIKDYSEFEITKSTVDTIVFGEGILPEHINFKKYYNNLIISYENNLNDEIEIYYFYKTSQYRIEKFVFNNGVVWEGNELNDKLSTFKGSDSDDTLVGINDSGNKIYGNAGNDRITGGNSLTESDYLYGGDGNDTVRGNYGYDYLYGDAGNDILGQGSGNDFQGKNSSVLDTENNYGNYYEGGTGNDRMYGSLYGDTYFFNLGDGEDLIYENSTYDTSFTTAQDIIKFAAGIFPEDILMYRDSLHLIITIPTSNNEIKIDKFFYDPKYQIELIEFNDGTIWNFDIIIEKGNVFRGTPDYDNYSGVNGYNNTLIGNGGNDVLHGADLNDKVYGNEGNDKLYGDFGYDYLYGGKGNDILGNEDNDFQGLDSLEYSETTSYGNYYEGGLNDDTLHGTQYGDTYFFNIGDGVDIIYETSTYSSDFISNKDIIKFGENIEYKDLTFIRHVNNLIIEYPNGKIIINSMFLSLDNYIEFIELHDGFQADLYKEIQNNLKISTEGLTVEEIFLSNYSFYDYNNENNIINNDINNIIQLNDTYDNIHEVDISWEKYESENGNDIISGGFGFNVFDGGYGNDYLGYNEDLTCNYKNRKGNNGNFLQYPLYIKYKNHSESNMLKYLQEEHMNTEGYVNPNLIFSNNYYITSGINYACGTRYGDLYILDDSYYRGRYSEDGQRIDEFPDSENTFIIDDYSLDTPLYNPLIRTQDFSIVNYSYSSVNTLIYDSILFYITKEHFLLHSNVYFIENDLVIEFKDSDIIQENAKIIIKKAKLDEYKIEFFVFEGNHLINSKGSSWNYHKDNILDWRDLEAMANANQP